ncbi:MAG: hypothetical protein IIC50_10700 [Planctomycetes bacterium]|nr:hypothetical protein [Planctomycetota bacterium]
MRSDQRWSAIGHSKVQVISCRSLICKWIKHAVSENAIRQFDRPIKQYLKGHHDPDVAQGLVQVVDKDATRKDVSATGKIAGDPKKNLGKMPTRGGSSANPCGLPRMNQSPAVVGGAKATGRPAVPHTCIAQQKQYR